MQKHKIDIENISGDLIEQLQRGAFLVVKSKDKINTMTIGWGQIGIMWGMQVFVAPVRLSRYTYELLKDTDEFCVSVPRRSEMTKELAYCGSKSGRDVDKIKALNLSLGIPESVKTPIIDNCRLHLECQIISRVPLTGDNFSPDYLNKFYKAGDFHVLFYGKINECYLTDR